MGGGKGKTDNTKPTVLGTESDELTLNTNSKTKTQNQHMGNKSETNKKDTPLARQSRKRGGGLLKANVLFAAKPRSYPVLAMNIDVILLKVGFAASTVYAR